MITYGSTTLTSYNTITKIEVYYYKSTSATSLSGGSWSTTKPTWENGKYIWQKIRTTYEGKLENGQYYSESDPVNITGQQGQQGETGASAYSYKLTASDTIVTISKTGVYSTNSITFSATSKQGTDNVTAYSGRFKIETTSDGITWTTRYPTSGTGVDESSTTFTIPANISNIRCSLYQTGGMTVLLDITSVSIVQDGTDGIDGTSENLLMDVYAPSLTKIKAPWNRYISNASYTTITTEFIEEANLPDPNATHFLRITDSSASNYGRGLCFYSNGTPPFINGHTYKIGCWVRKHAGEPKINAVLGSIPGGFHSKNVSNTDWEWIEWVRTFGETDGTINTHNSTYKRLYFYFYNNNVEGSSLDMCGFRLENVQTDISTARNLLLKTEKLTDWGITNGAVISDGIVTIPEVTANTVRGIYSTKNFDYELIRNQTAIFSVRVKAKADEICACNLCIGLVSAEDSTAIQKYNNNYVHFTGTGNWQTICIATPINDEFFASGDGTVDYDNCWAAVKIESLETYHNGFQVKEPQFSLGTSATAWSPAPEDVNENIQQVQDNLDNLEIGGRNLLPFKDCLSSISLPVTNQGITLIKEEDGWIRVSGTRTSSTTMANFPLWINPTGNNYNAPINNNVPQENNEDEFTLSLEIEGTPFIIGDTYTTSTHVVAYGNASGISARIGGINGLKDTRVFPTYMSVVRYYIGVNCEGSVDGRFRVKLEKGGKATNWTPAPEDIETEIASLEEDLKTQIDEKIQTYYQATNPAESWSVDERSAHDGDLWYYTGDTTATYTKDNVYRYNGSNNTWTVYSASGELFDKLDGKTTVFYGSTTGTYAGVETGDYLVDSTDGSSYRYDGSNWVKVTDYKTGIDAAQASADIANDKIDNLEIGGRNLLLDTATERISPASSNNSAYVAPVPMMSDYGSSILNNRDDYFTYSFDYEVTGNEASEAYIYVQVRGSTVPSASKGYYSYVLENPTGKHCCTFKLTEAQATGDSLYCGIRLRYATNGAILRVWNIKLERGTRATDWTPAPEDAQAEINTALSQSIWYATCDTAGEVLIKEATITPTVNNFVLNVGTTVNVKFENANKGDRNSLKLNVNNTGDKDIRYMNNATMVAIPSNGYIIAGGTYLFVYDGTYWVIQNLNYNTNDNYYDRRQHKNSITAVTAITEKHLIVGNSTGYQQIASNSGGVLEFDLGYPILWAYSSIAATKTSTATYEAYPSVNFSTSGAIQDGAANKMLWLKGTIRGNTFTLASANFLTTRIPTSEDGMYYIPLGIMSSTTAGYFSSSNRIYAYVDDEFQPLDNAAALKATSAYETAIQARSEIVQTQETLSLQIRDISIGGANLFEKTKSFEGIANNNSTHDALTEFVYKDLTVRYANIVTFNNSVVELSAYQFTNLTSDTWYTFSFYAKGNADIGFMYAGSGNAVIDDISVSWDDNTYTGFNTTSISSNIIWLTPTDKWQRYSVTFHVEEQDITALHRLIGLYARPVSDNVELITETKDILRTESGTDVHLIMEGNEILICGYKLELGNKPTDWTPSDKDKAGYDNIISQINLSQEGIAIRADKIRFEGMITANEGFSIDEYGNMTANNGTFNGVFESYATDINENTFDLSINNGHIHFYNNDRTLTDDARHVGYIGGIRNSVSYISGEEKINDAIIIRLDNDCDFIIDSQETLGTERVLRVTNHSNDYISVDYWKDLHVYLGKKIQMYGYENNQYPEIIFKRYISDTNQYITRGTLALHSATGTSDINDRLYLYAKNQGNDLAGDQYLYFAGKGLKYSSSGQPLRTGYVATHKYIATQQFSITDQTITKGSSQNFEIDVTRDGYTPIMCTVTATSGTGAFYLSIYHWTIIGNTVRIFTHNNSTTTDAANITIWVNVLYKLTY